MIKRDLPPTFVSELIAFPYATCARLQNIGESGESSMGSHYILGRISKDGLWSYLINESCLEITSTMTGERISAWKVLNPPGTKNYQNPIIICAEELRSNNSSGPKLVLGIDNGSCGGLVCLFNIKTSEILKTIEIPKKVTAIEVISSDGGSDLTNKLVSVEFRCMSGVVAVGTAEGNVYIVDLCLDTHDVTEFNKPARLIFVSAHAQNIHLKRSDAIARERHLCMVLRESTPDQNEFCFKNTEGNTCFRVKKGEIWVTSIKYIPQLCSLAVGYNVSAFHLWNLRHLILEYSDSTGYFDESGSVIKFAFQEPENDPRLFCYLWVAKSDTATDSATSLTMYALSYANKHLVPTLGHYYENLLDCGIRFEHVLTSDSHGINHVEMSGSRLIGCTSLESYSNGIGNLNNANEEGLEQNTVSLLIIAWEAWQRDSSYSKSFIAIFDLNQWYRTQMPGSIHVSSGLDLCPFFGTFSLEEIMGKTTAQVVLIDVQVVRNSLCTFQKTTSNELHLYPSSLAFRICCLTELGIINASYLGMQRQILFDLKQSGSDALIEPQNAFNLCVFGGLLKSADIYLSKTSQREALLSLALENNMLDFISTCIAQWGNRELSGTGCSSRLILEWAWKKMTRIKNELDKLCLPLFSYCGNELDSAQVTQFHQLCVLLQHLMSVLQFLVTRAKPHTNQGLCELEARINVATLIHTQYSVIKWCHGIGLLPEREESNDANEQQFVIPMQKLKHYYKQRRINLQKINPSIRETDLLLIDGIISRIGEPLSRSWGKDGGFSFFPPPNLYSVLKIYLIDGINLTTKHQIVLYFFLDLIVHLSDNKFDDLRAEIMNFSAAFAISPAIAKVTYAFWLLDHADFPGAINLLLNPLVNLRDIEPWQSTVIMKAFLYQDEHEKALKYLKILRPIISTPEDMKLCLTIHITNGLIVQAHQFLRECHDHAIAEELLEHFFLGCQQTKCLQALFRLPLNKTEREYLYKFLHTSNEQYAQEMLIMFCLQRNEFVQAFALNDELKTKELPEREQSLRDKRSVRNSIVDSYVKVLPQTHRMLLFNSDFYSSTDAIRDTFKPQPLSTVVRANETHAMSQDSLIKTVMDKIGETNARIADESSDFVRRRKEKFHVRVSDNLPFVGPPVASTNDNDFPTEVIYPHASKGENETLISLSEYSVSPSKRFRLSDTDSVRRRKSRDMTAELMSTLQTIPLRRKIPLYPSLVSVEMTTDMTPQSILKVRQLVQGSTSPSQPMDRNSFTHYPVYAPSTSLPIQETISDEEKPGDMIAKQIRFELPDVLTNTLNEEKITYESTELTVQELTFPPPRRPLHASDNRMSSTLSSPSSSSYSDKEKFEEYYFSPPLDTTRSKTLASSNESITDREDVVEENNPVVSDENLLELNLELSESESFSDIDLKFTRNENEDSPSKRSETAMSTASSVSWHSIASPSESSNVPGSSHSTPTTPLNHEASSVASLTRSSADVTCAPSSTNLRTDDEDEELSLPDLIVSQTEVDVTSHSSDNSKEEKDISECGAISVENDDFLNRGDYESFRETKIETNEDRVRLSEEEETSEPMMSVRAVPDLKTPPKLSSPVRTSLRLSKKKSPQSTTIKLLAKGKGLNFNDERGETVKSKRVSTPTKKQTNRSQLMPVTNRKKENTKKGLKSERTPPSPAKRNYSTRLRDRTPESATESTSSVTYAFSPPVVLNRIPSRETLESTEEKTFIFSPPLTRARSKLVKNPASKTSKTSEESGAEKEKRKITKTTKKSKIRRPRSPQVFVSDSPISFVSPVADISTAKPPRRSTRIMKAKTAPGFKRLNAE